MKFCNFPDISLFSLSRSAAPEATGIYQLLLMIPIRFICSKRKICLTIKKFQNIINMTVGPLLFGVYNSEF